MVNTVMKWFFWLCGSTAVLIGMSAILAGTVDQHIGVTIRGLGIMFASTIPFHTADYFEARRLKTELSASKTASQTAVDFAMKC